MSSGNGDKKDVRRNARKVRVPSGEERDLAGVETIELPAVALMTNEARAEGTTKVHAAEGKMTEVLVEALMKIALLGGVGMTTVAPDVVLTRTVAPDGPLTMTAAPDEALTTTVFPEGALMTTVLPGGALTTTVVPGGVAMTTVVAGVASMMIVGLDEASMRTEVLVGGWMT